MKKYLLTLAAIGLIAMTGCSSVQGPRTSAAFTDWNQVLEKKPDAFNAGTFINTDPKPAVQVLTEPAVPMPVNAARRAVVNPDGSISLVR